VLVGLLHRRYLFVSYYKCNIVANLTQVVFYTGRVLTV